jgi:hypothetical protein
VSRLFNRLGVNAGHIYIYTYCPTTPIKWIFGAKWVSLLGYIKVLIKWLKHVIKANVMNSNYVSFIYLSFQLNISCVGLHILKRSLTSHVKENIKILIKWLKTGYKYLHVDSGRVYKLWTSFFLSIPCCSFPSALLASLRIRFSPLSQHRLFSLKFKWFYASKWKEELNSSVWMPSIPQVKMSQIMPLHYKMLTLMIRSKWSGCND